MKVFSVDLVSKSIVSFGKYEDYAPLISTIVNIVKIFQKIVLSNLTPTEEIKNNFYIKIDIKYL